MLWIKIRRRKYEWKYKNIIYHWMERITRLAENSIQLIWKAKVFYPWSEKGTTADRQENRGSHSYSRQGGFLRAAHRGGKAVYRGRGVCGRCGNPRCHAGKTEWGSTYADRERAWDHLFSFLFYMEISETQLAEKMGLARTTLQSQKYRILETLKDML